jgi:hypothetical protein
MPLLDQPLWMPLLASGHLSAVRLDDAFGALKEVDLRPKARVLLEHFSSTDWRVSVQAQVPLGLLNL